MTDVDLLEKELARDNAAFAQACRERDAKQAPLLDAFAKAIGPVIKEHVAAKIAEAVAPLERRIAELERRRT